MADQSARKLAVILHADVVGSTALVRHDETLAHDRIRATFNRLSKMIHSYGGIAHEIRGDAIVAEFDRASDAIAAALAFQTENTQLNSTLDDDVQAHLRIGIAMGEVVVADNTVTGDGVVLAQRLEQLAESGRVCIQDAAYQTVPKRLPFEYQNLGEREVKGFDDPVRVFAVTMKSGVPVSLPEPRKGSGRSKSTWRSLAAAAATIVIAMVGGLVWWQPWLPRQEPAAVDRMAYPLPDKPSIAVLPFINMSGDAEQEYFVDGVTEDLITDLSKLSGLFVIARNSSFTYKGEAVKVAQVAEELGVRYVLEGSVRRAREHVRINAQLVDAIAGGHVWAERYDIPFSDVFTVQDKVTKEIVRALAINLTVDEERRPSKSGATDPRAYDAFLRGWAYFRRNTPDDFAKAIPFFEEAIALDPGYTRAHAALAAIFAEKYNRVGTSGGHWAMILGLTPEETVEREKFHLDAAMEDPVPLAYMASSRILTADGRHVEAIREAEQALALDPNDPVAHEAMAIALIFAGRPEEGEKMITEAMRLDPLYPYAYLVWLGLAQFGMERFEEAAASLLSATQQNLEDDRALILLAASLAHLGQLQEAVKSIEKVNQLRLRRQHRLARNPDKGVRLGIDIFTVGAISLNDVNTWPFNDQKDRDRLREGLRLASVPATGEEPDVSPLQVAGASSIDAADAKKLFDRGVLFIDVRGDADWQSGHIPDAVHLDLDQAFTEARLLDLVEQKDKDIVIYCMGPRCLRSSMACAKAVSWGFEKVHYFREGVPGWRAAGYAINVP